MTIERRDQPTERQLEAWAWANAGQRTRSESPLSAAVLIEHAKDLYGHDMHGKITELFQKGDEQNELLDGIATMRNRGEEVPIFELNIPYLGDAGDEVEFPGELSGSLRGTGE